MIDDYATLFASSANSKNGSMLFYRPHEIEGTTRQDWRFEMPQGEDITCTILGGTTLIFSHCIELFTCCCVYFKRIRTSLHNPRYSYSIIQTKVYACRNLRDMEELCHGSGKWRSTRRWSALKELN
jgi:hypothetical protein